MWFLPKWPTSLLLLSFHVMGFMGFTQKLMREVHTKTSKTSFLMSQRHLWRTVPGMMRYPYLLQVPLKLSSSPLRWCFGRCCNNVLGILNFHGCWWCSYSSNLSEHFWGRLWWDHSYWRVWEQVMTMCVYRTRDGYARKKPKKNKKKMALLRSPFVHIIITVHQRVSASFILTTSAAKSAAVALTSPSSTWSLSCYCCAILVVILTITVSHLFGRFPYTRSGESWARMPSYLSSRMYYRMAISRRMVIGSTEIISLLSTRHVAATRWQWRGGRGASSHDDEQHFRATRSSWARS